MAFFPQRDQDALLRFQEAGEYEEILTGRRFTGKELPIRLKAKEALAFMRV